MSKVMKIRSFMLKYVGVPILITLSLVCCTNEASEGVVVDTDGNEYGTVRIGEQLWMAENLKVMHYRDGSTIPNVEDGNEWSNLETGAYSAYENNSEYASTLGLLYNWYAAMDIRGICPEGWHVPSDEEWMELEIYLGISEDEVHHTDWRGTDEGGKLKEAGTQYWQDPNTDATNETGFSARPGGGRAGYSFYGGNFYYVETKATYWTSTESNSTEAILRELENDETGIFRFSISKRNGFSIRCLRD